MATILMVTRNCARAALNDENCLDRIKDMWLNLQASVQNELDFIMRELAKEKLVGVATFGNSGAY
jgi:plasmid maintenance system antidote protein VapI